MWLAWQDWYDSHRFPLKHNSTKVSGTNRYSSPIFRVSRIDFPRYQHDTVFHFFLNHETCSEQDKAQQHYHKSRQTYKQAYLFWNN